MTVLKLGHLGDPHISQRIRPDERKRAINAAIDIFEAEKCDLIVIPGDVYEASASTADEAEMAEYLIRMGGIAPVVICRGNHDQAGQITALGRLRTAPDALGHRHPVLVTEGADVWDVAGFRVAAVSHFTKAHAAAQMTDMQEQDSATVAHARQVLAGHRRALAWFAGPTLLIWHGDVAGAVASNGESRRDAALLLTVADLAGVGASAVALNHIHRGQTLDPDGRIWYAGSPYQKDFGERADRKSVVVATFSATGCLVERGEYPLPQTPMYKFEAILMPAGWQEVEHHHPIGEWRCSATRPIGAASTGPSVLRWSDGSRVRESRAIPPRSLNGDRSTSARHTASKARLSRGSGRRAFMTH